MSNLISHTAQHCGSFATPKLCGALIFFPFHLHPSYSNGECLAFSMRAQLLLVPRQNLWFVWRWWRVLTSLQHSQTLVPQETLQQGILRCSWDNRDGASKLVFVYFSIIEGLKARTNMNKMGYTMLQVKVWCQGMLQTCTNMQLSLIHI